MYDITKKAKKSPILDTSPVGYYSVADINHDSEIQPVYAQLINDILSYGFSPDFEKNATEVEPMYASVDDTEVQPMYASVDDVGYLPANKYSTAGNQPLYTMSDGLSAPATQKKTVSVAIGDVSTGNNGYSPVVILNETAWQQQFHNGGYVTPPGSMPTSSSTVRVLDASPKVYFTITDIIFFQVCKSFVLPFIYVSKMPLV